MAQESLPRTLSTALKEWAVAVRALREGRQVILLRKGGIREAEGEFVVEARNVLLFPTFEHQMEQPGTLQPCYTAWLEEEQARRPPGENVRIGAAARITDILVVTNFDALLRLGSQHIYSEKFIRYRIENEPHKPLYCLFLRAYNLPSPVTVPMEMDYYGCRSWITLTQPIGTAGAAPVMGDAAYAERVRITKDLLAR
jgi:hypothetical protein